MKNLTTLFLLFFVAQFSFGQYQRDLTPRTSPKKAIQHKVGYTDVDIQYSSPAVKGRPIWGELVPFNKVWRAGANEATTIEFSTDVTINEETLEKGKYSFFVIPNKDGKWTAIFSNQQNQWGAYEYDKEQDALRVEVAATESKFNTEYLVYTVNQKDFNNGSIGLQWESIQFEVPFVTNYFETFKNGIETKASEQPAFAQWVVYMQGASYLAGTKEDSALAMNWINKAEQQMETTTQWDEEFYPRDYIKGQLYWTKAQLLANNNKFGKAKKYVKKMKKMENDTYYQKNKERRGIDKTVQSWK